MRLLRISDRVTIVPEWVAAVRLETGDSMSFGGWPAIYVTMAMGQEIEVARFGPPPNDANDTMQNRRELWEKAHEKALALVDEILAATEAA
jgi:hypothetical protein